MPRKPKRRKAMASFIKYSAIILMSFLLYLLFLTTPVDRSSDESKVVVIKKGASTSSIAKILEDQGLVRSSLVFKAVVYKEGLARKIQAGSFRLSPSQSTKEIAHSLTEGKLDSWMTIPEGYRNEQIAEIAKETFGVDEDAFLKEAQGLQGMLFPDTYLIPEGASEEMIVNILNDTYENNMSPLREKIRSLTFSEQEIVNLAAILERETFTEQEKPIVAGILIKRLENGWPLQADATLQYIRGEKGEWWPVPRARDRALVSPYNTYTNPGLPPTPIANPGITSILAVIEPEDSSYWYYIHDSDGVIRYASTLEEHNQNINKYLR